jgi:hypothetical protein
MNDNPIKPSEPALCGTCLERGRERPATHKELKMCDDCFNGKPFCLSETVGGDDPARRAWQRRYGQRHHEKLRDQRRKWREKNSETVREYQRGYRGQRPRENPEDH